MLDCDMPISFYKNVLPLFGAADAAPNNGKTVLYWSLPSL